MDDYSASYSRTHNTTRIQPERIKIPPTSSGISVQSPVSPTKPFSKKEKKSKLKPKSTSKTKSPVKAATRLAFGAVVTDPYAAYPDQLTQARTNASQRSAESNSSSNTASHNSSGSAVRMGAIVAVGDRRHAPTTAEQKMEQKANKEKPVRTKSTKKAGEIVYGEKEVFGADRRKGSLSSTSLTGSNSSATRISSDPTSFDSSRSSPFTRRHGRRYLRDTTLPYPLPCDLMELHRQTMHTMLLVQVFGGPVCTPNFQHKHPRKVLEIACGTGYWSSLCHQYFARQGHSVEFVGTDIAPLCPDMSTEHDMKWQFVQHDLRKLPLPFEDEEFDMVMVKDMSLVVTPTTGMQQNLMDEYVRILRPGGSLEIWDADHTLRMLLPHTPPLTSTDDSESEDEEQERANATGTYTLTAQTPLMSPQNQYLIEYNGWLSEALAQRNVTSIPCSHIRPLLCQEDDLMEIESRRLAIPLGEVRWEREGVGGAITKNNASRRSSESTPRGSNKSRKALSTGQAALRQAALLTVVQKIEALEPILREANGKSHDEWDRWQSNMMNDLMKHNGSFGGECMEVGAWWATKKPKKMP